MDTFTKIKLKHIKLDKMKIFKIGDLVSFTEDYTHQFDVYDIVATNDDGTIVISDLEGVFSTDLFTIVHTY